MKSSSLLLSTPIIAPCSIFSGNLRRGKGRSSIAIPVSKRDANYNHNHNGKLVDESMIELRRRIQEIKAAETPSEAAPSHWMEWEKRWYDGKYNSDVYEIVGLLQSKLMGTRPGLALAMVFVVLFSVPTSSVLILSHLVSAIRG